MSIARRLIPAASGGGNFLEEFIFEVTVGAGDVFTLPLDNYGEITPNFTVDWGDGSSVGEVTSRFDPDSQHIYSSAGTYTVTIFGIMPSFKVNNNVNIRSKITAIIDFGITNIKELDFNGCSNITSIPASSTMAAGYRGLEQIINYNAFMKNTSITSIPSDLFAGASNANIIADAFSGTDITSVPSGFFDNCINVFSFASCFLGCTSLATIPIDLFDNCSSVVNMSSIFRNCISLENIPSFANNTSVTTFANIFNMSTTSNQSSLWELNEALWLRNPEPLGTDAFNNCTGIGTNPDSDYSYADIPLNWK